MTADEMTRYITDTFDDVEVLVAAGYTFFFYDPDRRLAPEQKHPFATLAADDNDYDKFSNLSRPGVYRLNIGVKKETYRSILGPPPPAPGPDGLVNTGHDFTTLDQIMPHPNYMPQSWVCVLSPTSETLEVVKQLLNEAYAEIVRKYSKTKAANTSQ